MDIMEMIEASGLGSTKDSKGETFSDFMKRMSKESNGSGLGKSIIADKGNVLGGPKQSIFGNSNIQDLMDTIDKTAIDLLHVDSIKPLFERMTSDSRKVLFTEVKKAADAQDVAKVAKLTKEVEIVDQIIALVKRLSVIK